MTTPTQTPPRTGDSRARPAITWALWAPGRLRGLIITAWAALTIAGIAGAIAITGAAQDATTPPATHAPPTHQPGDLATGGHWKPAPPTASGPPPQTAPPTSGALPAPGVPAQSVAVAFIDAWLAGAADTHTTAAHQAWTATLAPYGTPGLMAALTRTRLDDLPRATLTTTTTATLLGTTTVTGTLTDASLVVVQLQVSDGAWRVTSVRAS